MNKGDSMFNYSEERQHAIAVRNFKLVFDLIEQELAEERRREEYFQKFLADDMRRCLGDE